MAPYADLHRTAQQKPGLLMRLAAFYVLLWKHYGVLDSSINTPDKYVYYASIENHPVLSSTGHQCQFS